MQVAAISTGTTSTSTAATVGLLRTPNMLMNALNLQKKPVELSLSKTFLNYRPFFRRTSGWIHVFWNTVQEML